MPPDAAAVVATKERKEEHGHSKHHKERIGNYIVGIEIGRGSFATVYKGYRSKTREPIAIKAVSRQKLTTKLLENLESEINILKVISHPNITALEDCFKNDTHIYLVMEFCSGSDLSFYIKNRGRLPTLDYVPRGSLDNDKIFYPHPPSGGLAEAVTRCFLGQLVHAVEFLRKQNLIHRDIKPQNLLLQPASESDIAAGHPLGIPLLKVADFGFARILPASAMAETLCGSPLYMAPEILRYEKYDAKVDLWSVGAVLFEMAVGKPPFRASNHVELLRKIEKGEDKIKFPDESSRASSDPDSIPPLPVPSDIKGLIRALLKRHSADRMSFEAFFGSRAIWESHMIESHSTEDSMDLEISTDSSSMDGSRRIQELVEVAEEASKPVPTHAPQPISTDTALNPQPARLRPDLEPRRSETTPMPVQPSVLRPVPIRRTMPKYYVQDDTTPPPAQVDSPSSNILPVAVTPSAETQSNPRPIRSAGSQPIRRYSGREPASVEEAQPITPSSNNPPLTHRNRVLGEGSPLAATPPITMTSTGKDESALEGDDSIVGREYVVIEKRNVEVNALADEVDQAARKPASLLSRRPSSRTSVVSRPVSAFKPAGPTPPSTTSTSTSPRVIGNQNAVVPMSYSPPFGLSSTPPFAIPPVSRQGSGTPVQIGRNPSIPSSLNVFPPAQIYDGLTRYGSSPSSLQTGTLARALTNTALRLIGTSANAATNVINRATSGSTRRPTIIRTGEMDNTEEKLLRDVEDVARKAFALFELADARLSMWQQLGASAQSNTGTGTPHRRSSSSSVNSEVFILRQQEVLAGEATNLLYKSLTFIVKGIRTIQEYWTSDRAHATGGSSQELNEMVQWLRARFNECFEKAEFAKSKSAEELPFVEKLIHDRALDASRQGAMAELAGEYTVAERTYENAIWLLQTLLDDVMYDGGQVREEDRAAIERFIQPVQARLAELKRKMESSNAANTSTISANAAILHR